MHGKLTPPETGPAARWRFHVGAFASHETAEALHAAAMVTVCEQTPRVSAQQAVATRPSHPQDPAEDDLPAGNAPKAPAQPPRTPKGGKIHNTFSSSVFKRDGDAPKSTAVTEYPYRQCL